MSGFSEKNRGISRKAILLIAIPVILLVIIILIWFALRQDGGSQLMPPLPEPTEVDGQMAVLQEPVTFSDLNADPIAYLNKVIVVSGDYLTLERENCLNYTGPDFGWSLTAENLQLDVLGYERIIDLVSDNTPMTIQGTWRLYQGPLGCGKGPPDGNAWYLEVKKILQPNPLVGKDGQAIPVIVSGQDPNLPALVPTLVIEESSPTVTAEVTTAQETVPAETVTATLAGQQTFTSTPAIAETVPPTFTLSPTPATSIATATSNVTSTAPTASPTPESTNDNPGPTATNTPEQPPAPATSTDVPGGYPGPGETFTPTPTVDPYP